MNNTQEYRDKYGIKSEEDVVRFTTEMSQRAREGEVACISFDNLENNERKSVSHTRKDGGTNILHFPNIVKEKLEYDKLQFKFFKNQSKHRTDLIQFN